MLALCFGLALLVLEHGPPDDLTFEASNLPRAVSIVAEGADREGEALVPFERREARIAEGWVECKQFLFEGSLGYVLFDVTFDDGEQTVLYNLKSQRGYLDSRLKRTGFSRIDPFLSPIGFVRLAQHLAASGKAIPREDAGGSSVYILQTDPLSTTPVRIEVDQQTRRIVSATYQATPAHWARFRYLDWQPVDERTWHPTRVEFESQLPNEPQTLRIISIKQIRSIDPSVLPIRPVLPASAVLEDQLSGLLVDGAGNTVSVPADQTGSGASMWNSVLSANGLLTVGAVLVLGAGAWILRRKLVRGPA